MASEIGGRRIGQYAAFHAERDRYNRQGQASATDELEQMSFRQWCVRALSAVVLVPILTSISMAATEPTATQYLLFQIFVGAAEPPGSGVYHRYLPKHELLRIARHVAETVRPLRRDPNRVLGFAVGPIAMDQGEDGARSVIRDAFDVALETDMAVALHLDDYMFWAQARWSNGRLLREAKGTAEWTDWSGTPAGALEIGWLPNVRLAPQLCYESPEVKDFVAHWTRYVLGDEVKTQFDRLIRAGKGKLFAGVIVGWESNLAHGYCALSHLGYSSQTPPADFDHERERVLQRHIESWAKGIYDAGIPRHLIFSHVAAMPKREYERITATFSRQQIRGMPQSTAFRAYWTGFNSYSSPGFSAYLDEAFEDIYQATQAHNSKSWAMAEGTNMTLGASMEAYLARSFNHGATIVNLFGGFQRPQNGGPRSPTVTEEALAAYRKFLEGDSLVEPSRP
jgi:hypothetical protein